MSFLPAKKRSRLEILFLALLAGIVIAGLLFAIPATVENQRKPIARDYISGLLQAIEGFHTTYDAIPKAAPAGGEMTTDGEPGIALLTVLLGKEEVGRPMDNPKQIRFLNTEETRYSKKGGLLYSGESGVPLPVGLYDPWGNPFRMRFAPQDGSGIQDPFHPDQRIQGKTVIVFSYGPNGKPNAEDDLKSW